MATYTQCMRCGGPLDLGRDFHTCAACVERTRHHADNPAGVYVRRAWAEAAPVCRHLGDIVSATRTLPAYCCNCGADLPED